MTHHTVPSNGKTHKDKKVVRRRKQGGLGDKLVEALKAEGKTLADLAPTPAKPRRRKANLIKRTGIGWEHDIAEITVSVDEGNCENIVAEGPYTSAKLIFDDHRPQSLNIRMLCKTLEEDLLVYSIQSGTNIRRVKQTELPHLMIPITWKDGGPQMRKAHEDNAGIMLMDKIGRFVHLEIGVTVRSHRNEDTGKFKWAVYLNLQEVFTGQVVRTTVARAKELGLAYVQMDNGKAATVIPLWGYHDYPGANWLGMNPAKIFGMETVVPTALAEDRSVPLSEASFESWDPPELGEPSRDGKKRGVVLWYNCAWLGGAGFIQMDDGSSIFVHWSQLRGIYAPQPMSVVEFEIGSRQGKKQATWVRAM